MQQHSSDAGMRPAARTQRAPSCALRAALVHRAACSQALLDEPAHHEELLALVTAWPPSVFHPPALIDAIAQRMQR